MTSPTWLADVRAKAAELPGVNAGDFVLNSELHGAAHVNRVIVLGQCLARAQGAFRDLRLNLWAATYLHDLERQHDDVCLEHGAWAVERRLPGLTPLFLRHGVRPCGIEAIAEAVRQHCRPVEVARSHPDWALIALLKDADALDRWRLGDLDPSFLRTPAAPGFMDFSRDLFDLTDTDPRREQLDFIWSAACSIEPPPAISLT